jgi:CelD/BcsL family acetyltransferase involved in cellulose biosynthesis
MTQRLQIRCYSHLAALRCLRPAWESLLSRVPHATIFNTWEWLAPWWDAYGTDRELMVLAFFEGTTGLVGLAPLSITTKRSALSVRYRLLGLLGDGSGDSDNLDFLALPGYEKSVVRSFMDFLEQDRSAWDCCQLNTLPDGSPVLSHLLEELGDRGWPDAIHPRLRSAIALPADWDSYLSQISKNERRKLLYYSRRVARRFSAEFHKCSEESQLADCLDALFELHSKRWQRLGEPGTFVSAERRQFYGNLAQFLLRRGWLDFWLLKLNGVTVAAQFALRYRDTVYALQEGFDPSYALDSVGFVLRGHVLRELISQGVRHYDFLATPNPSKQRFGAVTGSYIDVHFARPLTRGSACLHLLHTVWNSKEWLRKQLPPSAWALLHWLNVHIQTTEHVRDRSSHSRSESPCSLSADS